MAVHEITMPALGMAQTEGLIVDWIKHVGDNIEKDEPFLQIETDKSVEDISSNMKGILIDVMVKAGESAPVGSVIGKIEDDASQVDYDNLKSTQESESHENNIASDDVEETHEHKTVVDNSESHEAPTTANLPPIAHNHHITQPMHRKGKILASPLAKSLAKEYNIDIADLLADGTITFPYQKKDVISFVENRTSATTTESSCLEASIDLHTFFHILEWNATYGSRIDNVRTLFAKINKFQLETKKDILFYQKENINVGVDVFCEEIWKKQYIHDLLDAQHITYTDDKVHTDVYLVYIEHSRVKKWHISNQSSITVSLIADRESSWGNLLVEAKKGLFTEEEFFFYCDDLIKIFENPALLLQ